MELQFSKYFTQLKKRNLRPQMKINTVGKRSSYGFNFVSLPQAIEKLSETVIACASDLEMPSLPLTAVPAISFTTRVNCTGNDFRLHQLALSPLWSVNFHYLADN